MAINSLLFFLVLLALPIGMSNAFPIPSTGTDHKDVGAQDGDYQYIPPIGEDNQYISFDPEDPQVREGPKDDGVFPSWFPTDEEGIPVQILVFIVVAIFLIFSTLIIGCVFLSITCLKQRSKLNKIIPMIEEALAQHTQLRIEGNQEFKPTQEQAEEILDHLVQERLQQMAVSKHPGH